MPHFKKAKDIKVGVIGYSPLFNMGRTHLREMKKAGMTPLAVCDLSDQNLQLAAQEWPGIETYKSVDQMLKKSDINLATIITPHNTHAQLALQCLKAGLHIVCEKPLAITTAECDSMINQAQKHKLVLSTYHNRHWDGLILNALKMIKAGKIGEVVRVEAHMANYANPGPWWRTSKTISGGILYDWGVHLLEYTFQIIESEITEVSGFAHSGFWADKTPWGKDTNEDEGFAVIRYKNGSWSTLTISNLDANAKEGQLEITGIKGTIVTDQKTWKLITIDGKGTKTIKTGSNPPSQSHRYYQNVAEYLTGQAKLIITPQWSRRPIHVLELAGKSYTKGTAQKTKYK